MVEAVILGNTVMRASVLEQEGEEGCGSSGEKWFGSFVDETFFFCSAVIDRVFGAIRPLPPRICWCSRPSRFQRLQSLAQLASGLRAAQL